ncbi:putative membrane protein, partial [Vibrio parahaemolyticus VP2007-007]
VAAMSAC